MFELVDIVCPYCGEAQTTDLDGSGGDQSYWQDCQICCSPIKFELSVSYSGVMTVVIKRDDE